MESRVSSRSTWARSARAGAAFGILSGILIIGLFVFPTPSGTAQDQLTNYNAQTWEIIGILDVLILLAAIPFAAYLRTVLQERSPGTASAAAILFIVGIVFAAGGSLIQAGAMSTLASTYTGPSASAADRAAAVLVTSLLINFSTSIWTLILLEAGIALFSIAMLDSRIVANWVADVGVASALATLVILALSTLLPSASSTSLVGFVGILVYFVLLLVWVFGSSAYLLRSARRSAVGAPVPA